MKKGDTVIVKRTNETELLDIVGKRGTIESADILGKLLVRIADYPYPFILEADEVRKIV